MCIVKKSQKEISLYHNECCTINSFYIDQRLLGAVVSILSQGDLQDYNLKTSVISIGNKKDILAGE